jgi:O-antigen ligase
VPLRRDDLSWVILVTGAAALVALAAAQLSYVASPVLAPALALLAAFTAAAWRRPALGLAGAGLALPLELVDLPLPSGALSPAEGGFALVGALYVLRLLARTGAVRGPQLRDWPVWVLLFVIAAGVVVAEDPAPAIRITLLWTFFYLVYLQAQSLDPREQRTALGGLAVGAAVLGGIGTVSYLTSDSNALFAGGLYTGDRAAGTFADANYYASMLALVILPATALALLTPRRDWWLGACAAVATAGLVFSLSRGGIIALAGGLLVLLAWGRARILLGAVLAVLIALTLTDANPVVGSTQYRTVAERLSTLGSSNLQTTNRRPQMWRTAIELGIANPVVGVGAHGFQAGAARASVFEHGAGSENTHNLFLGFLAEHGFLGLLAFLAFLGQLAARAWRALSGADGLPYALALGVAAALAGFLLQGMTQVQLRVNIIAAAFFLLAGMLTGLADRRTGIR